MKENQNSILELEDPDDEVYHSLTEYSNADKINIEFVKYILSKNEFQPQNEEILTIIEDFQFYDLIVEYLLNSNYSF